MKRWAISDDWVLWYSETLIVIKTAKGFVALPAEIEDADIDIPFTLYTQGLLI